MRVQRGVCACAVRVCVCVCTVRGVSACVCGARGLGGKQGTAVGTEFIWGDGKALRRITMATAAHL